MLIFSSHKIFLKIQCIPIRCKVLSFLYFRVFEFLIVAQYLRNILFKFYLNFGCKMYHQHIDIFFKIMIMLYITKS